MVGGISWDLGFEMRNDFGAFLYLEGLELE